MRYIVSVDTAEISKTRRMIPTALGGLAGATAAMRISSLRKYKFSAIDIVLLIIFPAAGCLSDE